MMGRDGIESSSTLIVALTYNLSLSIFAFLFMRFCFCAFEMLLKLNVEQQ